MAVATLIANYIIVVLIVDGNRCKLVLYYFQYRYFIRKVTIYIVKKNNDQMESK